MLSYLSISTLSAVDRKYYFLPMENPVRVANTTRFLPTNGDLLLKYDNNYTLFNYHCYTKTLIFLKVCFTNKKCSVSIETK